MLTVLGINDRGKLRFVKTRPDVTIAFTNSRIHASAHPRIRTSAQLSERNIMLPIFIFFIKSLHDGF